MVLPETGNAFEQDVAAGEEADEDAIDHILLADDDFGDFAADGREAIYGLLEVEVGHNKSIVERGEGPMRYGTRSTHKSGNGEARTVASDVSMRNAGYVLFVK